MKDMDDLNPDARRVLQLARTARTPSERDRQRIRAAITGSLGAGLAAQTASAAAAKQPAAASMAAAAGAKGLPLLKLACAIALTGALGSAGYLLSEPDQTPATGSQAAPPTPIADTQDAKPTATPPGPGARVTAPVPTASEQDAAGAAPPPSSKTTVTPDSPQAAPAPASAQRAPEREDARAHRRRRPRKRQDSQLIPGPDTLAAEARLLHQARVANSRGDGQAALRLLGTHLRDFPASQLAPERDALRVLSLCKVGDAARARRLATRLLREQPDSPWRRAIEKSCALR